MVRLACPLEKWSAAATCLRTSVFVVGGSAGSLPSPRASARRASASSWASASPCTASAIMAADVDQDHAAQASSTIG
eukprot:2991432-Pleurochrysis_carterae.AAC.1